MIFNAPAAIDALIDHPYHTVNVEDLPTSNEAWDERMVRREKLGEEFHVELNKIPRKGLISMTRILRPGIKYSDRILAKFGRQWLRGQLTRSLCFHGYNKALDHSLQVTRALKKPQE
jgi:hypothetical protein